MSTITRNRPGWFAFVAALALALTAACSADDPGVADVVSVSTDGEVSEPVEETVDQVEDAGPDAEDADAEDAGPDGGDAEEPPTAPLATVEGQPPFASLEIIDLRRVGETVTLQFATIGAESAQNESVLDILAAPQDQWRSDNQTTHEQRTSVSGVTLVDQVNRKRHLVLRDTDSACLCTRFNEQISGGERYPHSAQFPAPPADVDAMTVQVPGFPAVDSVPLRAAG